MYPNPLPSKAACAFSVCRSASADYPFGEGDEELDARAAHVVGELSARRV
jgi:L-ribulose-5-phosphate 3-epimerase UlaE